MHKGIQIDTIFDKTQGGSGGAAPDAACGTDHVGAVAVVPAFRQHKKVGESREDQSLTKRSVKNLKSQNLTHPRCRDQMVVVTDTNLK